MHTVLIGIGSNLGDRQSTILGALQRLRRFARIDEVSSYYETPPVGLSGPAFLNIAARLVTGLEPETFELAVRGVETAIGRGREHDLRSRPIDIDILYMDDLIQDFGRFEVPHPYIAERPFNLIPLAEIAGDFFDPKRGMTVAALAAGTSASGIHKKVRALHFFANRQEEAPDVRLSLNRVGVSRVRQPIVLDLGGREQRLIAEFTMVADLRPDKAGVHMSRFSASRARSSDRKGRCAPTCACAPISASNAGRPSAAGAPMKPTRCWRSRMPTAARPAASSASRPRG
jgi:2-amino-4-hydroxy-6-hydroxymethyldihydropteridine diphosphokinase